jgi:quercetin dioxygenase-like cupin family protein
MAIKNKTVANPITGQSIKFLQTANSTLGQLLEMETTYKAHSTEPASHYHPYQTEDFTVISGEVTVRINGELKTLKAGDQLNIPPNSIHAMWNTSDQPAKVNWQVRPAMETEYLLETTFGLAADGKVNKKGMPSILQVALSVNRYNKVFRLSKPPFIVQKIVFTLLSPFAYLSGRRATYKKYIDL